MQRECLVTIGLPFQNNERTMGLAIQSVFAQTFEEWEMLLIDDGSSDGSLEIARSVHDARVRVISDGTNKGLAHRLNNVAGLANGPLIARMDADDAMLPNRLRQQVAYMNANKEVDMVATPAVVIDEKEGLRGLWSEAPFRGEPREFLGNSLFVHPSVMARREWFLRYPYNESLRRGQDKELWLRTRQTSTFAKMDEPLIFYRQQGNFDLQKYRGSCRSDRSTLRRYGPDVVGTAGTQWLVVRSFAKESLYVLLTWLGREEGLVRRRSSGLSERKMAEYRAQMDIVASTEVPGLMPGVDRQS